MRVSLPQSKTGRAIGVGAAVAVVVPATLLLIPAQSAIATATVAPSAKVSWVHVKSGHVSPNKLLRASQLPNGYQTMANGALKHQLKSHKSELKSLIGKVTVSPQSCRDSVSLTVPAGYRAEAHRVFRKGSSMLGPYAGEVVAKFDSADSAHAAVVKAQTVAAACSNVTVTTPYGAADATVTPLNPSGLGDESAGYAVEGSVAGLIQASGTVIVVREGNYLVAVGQGGLGAMDSASVQALAAAAVARL